jgi:hypothetical protein
MPDEPSIESVIATRLADGAARKVTDVALGSFFSLILGGDSGVESQLAAISAKLDKLQHAVEHLQETVENFVKLFQATSRFMTLSTIINSGPVANTEGAWRTFRRLTKDNKQEAAKLRDRADDFSSYLTTISQVMTGTFPSTDGDLMTAAADTMWASLTGPNANPSDPAPLINAYQSLETYFHALIDVQVKAATMAVNGFMATSGEQNLAQGVAGDLLATMPQQCAIFFAAAESLAAHYHNDDTLLDMLMGPDTNDPIRRAAAFVDHLLGTTALARAWLWSGGGPSFYIGGNDISLPSSTTLIGPVEVTVAATELRTFPTNNNFWKMARFEFPGGLPDDQYAFLHDPPVLAQIKDNNIFTPPLPIFSLRPGAQNVLTSVVSLNCTSQGGLLLPSGFSAKPPYTIELWFAARNGGPLVVSYGLYSDFGYWSLGIEQNQLTLYLRGVAGPVSVTNLPDSGWTHLAVSYDGATFSYFMGGIPQFSARIDHLNSPTYIASSTPGGGYDGLMNELRVWNRALGPDELRANMHKRLTAGDGLANAYGFDRGTFHDRMGGPDLTLRGTFSFVIDRTNLRWLH